MIVILKPLLLLTLIAVLGCNGDENPLMPESRTQENPGWVDELIATLESRTVWNPPALLARYEYRDAIVYYLPPHCCDIPAVLYNEQGEIICSPSGGITGRGDGKCPDFYDERKNEKIIWKDSRTYPPED